jgi:hypothetical protein
MAMRYGSTERYLATDFRSRELTMPTNPRGLSFLSYRRSRLPEATRLIRAQHDHGIPTWQDVSNLGSEPTEQELRRLLRDDSVANVVLFLTPEVEDSPVIRQVELPEALKRVRQHDGFFMLPVAGGGLSYEGAAAVASNDLSIQQLSAWNMSRISEAEVHDTQATQIASKVLDERVKAIHKLLPNSEPVVIGLYARRPAPRVTNECLTLDWSGHFAEKQAAPDTWKARLLPAIHRVGMALRLHAPGRHLVASGFPTLPAAFALGCTFQATGGQSLSWSQFTPGSGSKLWSLDSPRQESGFRCSVDYGPADAKDVAVLISVADDVEPLVAQLDGGIGRFRAFARVNRNGKYPHVLESSGAAVDVALIVRDAMRDLRREHGEIDTVHLFAAIPAGLGVLIGQLLGTFGRVQTYEHVGNTGSGCYLPAALLMPSQ